jgi:DNA-directed RNA polymerase specialized sigma24 family protein
MRKPDPEFVAVATPIFLAEAVVAVALFSRRVDHRQRPHALGCDYRRAVMNRPTPHEHASQHPSFDLLESDAPHIKKLPAIFSKPILLLHQEKMNYAEIAADTNLPLGTVKSRISRGRDIIRRLRRLAEPMQGPVA